MELVSKALWFPDPETATEEGLVAVGGDLSIERLLLAYRSGIFPWPIENVPWMTWFSPNPRTILELDELHISRSMRRVLNAKKFKVTLDQSFEEVIRACATVDGRRGHTWITKEIIEAYTHLHLAGYAHSLEVWNLDHRLVGGIYGVSLGAFFGGESMFSIESNASKIALIALVEHLKARRFLLFDVQQATNHILSMGAREIPRQEFLRRLKLALQSNVSIA